MDFSDDIQRAKQLADQALGFLGKAAQPAHPRNFALLYGYFSRKFPALTRDFEPWIKGENQVTDAALGALYHRHFSGEAEVQAIHNASGVIEAMLDKLLSQMGEARDSNRAYGQALQDFSGHIEGDNVALDMNALRAALTGMLDETRKMEANSRRLESQFFAANAELTELKQTLDHMRQEAMTDGLTGIANRRSFDQSLSVFTRDADRLPLAMVMVDIDHFKKFNDSFGHQTGDQVLRLVAQTLVDCVRGQDFAARFGGEEFVILLPNTNLDGAYAVADNIRNKVAAKKITRRSTGESLGQITLSLGISLYRPGEDVAAFISRADQGLYLAKDHGRNRVSSVESLRDMAASA
ncbi:MAG TPA: GGDEF domain-containing protein [Alphaproteobacteria bacterium]|nr:GGDEF domain-containing protein [Alphaproteobacteria bacterium]